MTKLSTSERKKLLIQAGVLPPEQKSFAKKALGFAGNVGLGALKGAGEIVAGTESLMEKYSPLGVGINSIRQGLGALRDQQPVPQRTLGQKVMDTGMFKANTPGQQVGKTAFDIASFAVPATKVSKATTAYNKIRDLSRLKSLGTQVLGQGLTGAGVEATKQGELNKRVATTGAISGAVPVAGLGASKVAKGLKQFAFGKIVPTTITQAGKDVAKGLEIGEAVSRTGVSVSKKSLMNKISKLTNTLGGKLDDEITKSLKANPKKVWTMRDITNTVKKNILKDSNLHKELGSSPIDVPKVIENIDDVLKQYKALYGRGGLDLKQIQKLKVDLGQALQPQYDKAVGAIAKTKPFTEMALREQLKTTIEKEVPKAKGINKQLAPLYEAMGRLNKKGSYSGYLTDVIIGGAAASQTNILEDPASAMKAFLTSVLIKRGMTSTLAKTLAGTAAKHSEKLLKTPAIQQTIREIINAKSRNVREARLR
jgi:hypothetical protein